MHSGEEVQTTESGSSRRPLVIGVGGSAAAKESIERFLSRLAPDADVAVVLVLRHREALDEAWLGEQLRRLGGVRLAHVTDGAEIEGQTLYVCPANMITTLRGGSFAVRAAEQAPGERATIDSVLVALAGHSAERAIGVILAGTEGDGTLGIATLRDHSGLAISEVTEHASARLEGSSRAAAIADFAPADGVEDGNNDASGLVRSEHLEPLEKELRATRERLQATIAELVSTNEELKSSNEEYRSRNKELTTVNGELGHRVQALTRATSDMKGFLGSTQIATVLLDNEMRVMNFTPAVTQVLHLVETDIGRPVSHIKANIPIDKLYDDVRRVLRTQARAERELTAPESGTRYIIRVLPYRSIDNFIAGVVITFVDVTAITRAEEFLSSELQHRVRNTFSVVRSIARRTAENSTTVEDCAAHLDGRLNAFARVQSLATRDPEEGVDFEYLVAEELHAYNASEGEQVRLSGPTIRLQPKAAETFALAIHELATNAVKFGALSRRSGRIDANWRIEETGQIQLIFEWRERGGPPVVRPHHKGFGTELLERTLAFELNARTTLGYDEAGLYCRIVVPLNRRIVHTPALAGGD